MHINIYLTFAMRKAMGTVFSVYVDSGATETLVGTEMLDNIETKEGEAAKRGVKYEVADGTMIPNKGEKSFKGVSAC